MQMETIHSFMIHWSSERPTGWKVCLPLWPQQEVNCITLAGITKTQELRPPVHVEWWWFFFFFLHWYIYRKSYVYTWTNTCYITIATATILQTFNEMYSFFLLMALWRCGTKLTHGMPPLRLLPSLAQKDHAPARFKKWLLARCLQGSWRC